MSSLIQPVDVNALEEHCKIIQAGFVVVRRAELEGRRIAMTPEEQLYADFFFKERKLIDHYTVDNIIELEAERELLVKTIIEAKAAVYARDDKLKELRKSKNSDKQPGFRTSLNADQTSTDAINAIKERQDRVNKERRSKLSKQEKAQESLIATFMKAGMSAQDAENAASKLMKPSAIIAQIREKVETVAESQEKQAFANPFEKKTEISIQAEESKKPFINPFAKS